MICSRCLSDLTGLSNTCEVNKGKMTYYCNTDSNNTGEDETGCYQFKKLMSIGNLSAEENQKLEELKQIVLGEKGRREQKEREEKEKENEKMTREKLEAKERKEREELEKEELFELERNTNPDIFYSSEKYYNFVEDIICDISRGLSSNDNRTYTSDNEIDVDKMKEKLTNEINNLVKKKKTDVLKKVISCCNEMGNIMVLVLKENE